MTILESLSHTSIVEDWVRCKEPMAIFGPKIINDEANHHDSEMVLGILALRTILSMST